MYVLHPKTRTRECIIKHVLHPNPYTHLAKTRFDEVLDLIAEVAFVYYQYS